MFLFAPIKFKMEASNLVKKRLDLSIAIDMAFPLIEILEISICKKL